MKWHLTTAWRGFWRSFWRSAGWCLPIIATIEWALRHHK
jgi:hypothetical protein